MKSVQSLTTNIITDIVTLVASIDLRDFLKIYQGDKLRFADHRNRLSQAASLTRSANTACPPV